MIEKFDYKKVKQLFEEKKLFITIEMLHSYENHAAILF
jgi:hypothetical protein